jgi:DNA polymerase III delta prime subunit
MTHLYIGRDDSVLEASLIEALQLSFPEVFTKKIKKLSELEQHPDIHLLVAEKESSLGIEQLRQFFSKMHKKPFKALQQIGIIIGFEKATPEAQNASLKELEEHGSSVQFFLTATEENALLPTIKSRATMHYVEGHLTKEAKKEITELAEKMLLPTPDISAMYVTLSTKEWTRGSIVELMQSLQQLMLTQKAFTKLALLQRCSEYLAANVSQKHVALFLFFALR